MKYRPSAAEAMAEAEIQEIEGGQDAFLPDADEPDADEPDAEPEATDYGWADEDRYSWDDRLGRMIRWPVIGQDDAPPYDDVELEEGEPAFAYDDDEDGEDQAEDREPPEPPVLDDDERLMLRAFARALMDTHELLAEAVLPTSKPYKSEWLDLLLALHDDQMQMDAAARVFLLQLMLKYLVERSPERVKPTWSMKEKVGAFERWKTKEAMTEALEAARVQLVEEARALLIGLERMGWVAADVCLDQHGKRYKARFSNGTSAVLDASEVPVAQLLEGRLRARMEAAFQKKIPAPCPNPAPVGLDKNEPVPDHLVSKAPPSLTQIPTKQQSEKPVAPLPKKRAEKLAAKTKKETEARDAAVKNPGPKKPHGGRRLLVVLGSGSRSALPARPDAFYRDEATRTAIDAAKRALVPLRSMGAGWGVADEVLGWAEPDALMMPPDREPSEARKAEVLSQTAQAIYRKALQAGAKFVVVIGPQGRYRDGIIRALTARGIEVDVEKTAAPRPPAHDSADEAAAIRAVVTAMDNNLGAGGVAQRIYQQAPYLRVEAPNAQELRIGPASDPFEMLLLPDGAGLRVWVHFDPDADPRHPGEHLRRLPLQTLLAEHGAISDPYELARHIITQMAHESQEPGLHVAPGADKALPEPKPQGPAPRFVHGRHGWDWKPERGILFRARTYNNRPAVLNVFWLLDDGEREYEREWLRSWPDIEASADAALGDMRQGRAPNGWKQISGKPLPSAPPEPDPLQVAQTIWDGVVAEVARAHSDPERVRRVAASMRPTMVGQLAGLLGEMIAKAKAKRGA